MKRKLTKRKRKVVPTQHSCCCTYNRKIASMFDEVFDSNYLSEMSADECNSAVTHSDVFNIMLNSIDEVPPDIMLADACCIGFEAGRRMKEVEYLENICGYKEAK